MVFDPHEPERARALAGAPLASFKRRLLAYVIDVVLIFATYGPAVALLMHSIPKDAGAERQFGHSVHTQVTVNVEEIPKVAWTLWAVLYFGLFVWKTNGWTPGKRLLGIRVASLVQEKITLWQATERALGYGASALEGGFGFVQCIFTPNHTCTHDRIAETIVIRVSRHENDLKNS
jgi:uncharacterized RDD family membrane protein YckC